MGYWTLQSTAKVCSETHEQLFKDTDSIDHIFVSFWILTFWFIAGHYRLRFMVH